MKLLVDEGVDKPIVDLIGLSGFDAHYILETHRGIDDDQVLQIANEEARILLTQDKILVRWYFGCKKLTYE
jgi:predicted nuclease of predicted toxin-antitoxin system